MREDAGKELTIETGRSVSFGEDVRVEKVSSPQAPAVRFGEASDSASSSTRSSPGMSTSRPLMKRASTMKRLSTSSRSSARDIMARNALSYDTQSWFASFRMLYKTVKNDQFLLRPWIGLTIYATAIAVLGEALGFETTLALPTDVSIGIVGSMALLLTFRLNVCYNRWWEGRILWGVLITATRGIVTRLLAEGQDYYTEDPGPAGAPSPVDAVQPATPRQAAGYCIAFAFALRKHVLSERFDPNEVDAGLRRLLDTEEISRIARAPHPPLYALHCLRATLSRLVRVVRRRQNAEDGGGGGAVALELALVTPTQEMHTMLAGCERLVNTPCPAGYVGVLRMVILFFLLVLPNVLLDELKWWMVPVSSITSFAILAVEENAMHIEMPFGTDDDDLPLEAYCLNLLADVLMLMDEEVPMIPMTPKRHAS